jgi:subtilase family serine protease
MQSPRTRIAACAFALVALGITAAPAVAARPARSPVRGSAPGWAQPSRDRGAAAGGQSVSVTVYLPLRDTDGAQALAQQLSDPASATYGQYLTPQAFQQRFAPTDADVAAVKAFLRDAGLSVSGVAEDNRYVEASGSLAKAQAAFDTSVHRYSFRGRVVQAPSKDLSVPSSLSDKVLAVTGLDQSANLSRPQQARGDLPGTRESARHGQQGGTGAPPPDAFVNAPPCSTYFGEKIATQYPSVGGQKVPFAPCGYTPAQFQGAYGTSGLVSRGLDGRGVTVAITDAYAAPTILQDANQYATSHGQAAFGRKQFQQIVPRKFTEGFDDPNGDVCGEQGWYGEETLDVEAVHGMAPGANVLYVAGSSCEDADLLKALDRIVSRRRADIITNSWGDIGEDVPPDVLQAYTHTFIQAALEGIGVFYSSGDEGDDSLDTEDGSPAVDFPASHPLVTAVGGTALGVTKTNGYGFETGWATGTSTLSDDGISWDPPFPGDFLYGGGGGTSALFPEPFYQLRAVPQSVAHGHRAVPDVAMDGDPQTGMLVGETQTFPDGVRYGEYRIGGTSLSSPLYAGLEALADQAARHPHGFANPAIYALNSSQALHDVAPSAHTPAVVRVNFNNSVDDSEGTTVLLRSLGDEAQSLHLAPGWDNLTGVGTPNGPSYVGALGARH